MKVTQKDISRIILKRMDKMTDVHITLGQLINILTEIEDLRNKPSPYEKSINPYDLGEVTRHMKIKK